MDANKEALIHTLLKPETVAFDDLAFKVAQKYHTNRDINMNIARQEIAKELNELNYMKSSVTFRTNNLIGKYNITEKDIKHIFDELRTSNWIVDEKPVGTIVSINYDLITSKTQTKNEIIEKLTEENEKLNLHISLMPGGKEYLQVQQHFCENTGASPETKKRSLREKFLDNFRKK